MTPELLVKYMHFNIIKQRCARWVGKNDIQNYTNVVHLTNFKVRKMN